MGLLKSPIHPYVPNTPNPFTKELQAARELFLREIDNTEGWEGEEEDIEAFGIAIHKQ